MQKLFSEELSLRLDEEEFNEFFDCFDVDKNDKVSVNEFVAVIVPHLEKA